MSSDALRVGDYHIVRSLALGGMAELSVARRRDDDGEQLFVVKRLRSNCADDDALQKMLRQEGQLLMSFRHRNLVACVDIVDTEKSCALVLEYVDGCNVDAVIRYLIEKQEFVPCDTVAWIARELCRALAAVHNHVDAQGRPLGLVHRDVTPLNVLLSTKGEVKLADFGIVKSLRSEIKTNTGQLKGNVRYMSPEQACGDVVTAISDVYGVGVIAYELLSAQPYLRGRSELELLRQAREAQWHGWRHKRSDVPQSFEKIVQRAVRKEPETRFASAAALEAALSQFISESGGGIDAGSIAELVAKVVGWKKQQGGSTRRHTERAFSVDDVVPIPDDPEDHARTRSLDAMHVVSALVPQTTLRSKHNVLQIVVVVLAIVLVAIAFFWGLDRFQFVLVE